MSDDLSYAIALYEGDVGHEIICEILSLFCGLCERVSFHFVFVAFALLGVDDHLIEITGIVTSAVETTLTEKR